MPTLAKAARTTLADQANSQQLGAQNLVPYVDHAQPQARDRVERSP